MRDFAAAVMEEEAILAEGAVIERLRRSGDRLDTHSLATSLVFDDEGKEALREIYRSYLDVAADSGLPIVILAPTWKAGTDMCEKAGLDIDLVSRSCVEFMRETAAEYPALAERIFVGGLVGSRGDAYKPDEAPPRNEARRYHTPQIESLRSSGADFVLASTIPSVEEAAGIAMAASDVGVSLVMSYVIKGDGKVLDGTILGDAVERIDALGCDPPLFHMANCIHPANFARAMGRDGNAPLRASGRLIGLQANASVLDPDELDGREQLDADDPVRWAGAMAALKDGYGIKLLGGCCGTDERYIRRLAGFLTDY
ncbi:MAG: homocysteine S-methyltransferase family protein [Candidatus Krumholzibacteria bacterium]|nr:homocysteine S-methyltransferase family protein [Candidatus Krumholzibacteria bacterium]